MILQGRLEALGIFKIFKIFSKYLRVKLVELILAEGKSTIKRKIYSYINGTGNRTFLSEIKQLYEKVHIDKFPRETNPH